MTVESSAACQLPYRFSAAQPHLSQHFFFYFFSLFDRHRRLQWSYQSLNKANICQASPRQAWAIFTLESTFSHLCVHSWAVGVHRNCNGAISNQCTSTTTIIIYHHLHTSTVCDSLNKQALQHKGVHFISQPMCEKSIALFRSDNFLLVLHNSIDVPKKGTAWAPISVSLLN